MKRAEFHRIRLLPPAPEQAGARLAPLPEGGFECWHTLAVKFSKDARIFIAPLREGGYLVLPCAKHRGGERESDEFLRVSSLYKKQKPYDFCFQLYFR